MKRLALVLGVALVLVLGYAAVAAAAPNVYLDNGRIHGGYSSNTDACASCHSPHTAAGKDLLQWASVNATCFACHDGTIASTYNVKAGQYNIGTTASTAKDSAGLFGTGTEVSLSAHNINGTTTSAAPGGSGNSTLNDVYGAWGTEFNCAACHSPHGQGNNGRVLSPDPNGIAIQNKVTGETLTADAAYTVYTASKKDWIMGYPYSKNTAVYKNGTKQTSGYTIDYRNGKVTFAAANQSTDVITADYVPGVRVLITVNNKLGADNTNPETVSYTSGINTFCGACHTDYNTSRGGVTTGSGATLNGIYSQAYRHQVGMTWHNVSNGLTFEGVDTTAGTGKVTCLTCHYAHGVAQGFFVDPTTKQPSSTITETSGASKLKRMANMATCETCHQKGPASSY